MHTHGGLQVDARSDLFECTQQGGSMTNNTLLANVPVDLLYQALETEKGGVQIYTTALRLAINKDLRE